MPIGTCFNPRPRAGGDDLGRALRSGRRMCFNPRPRAGGDQRCACYLPTCPMSFNPRPRAGGDVADAAGDPLPSGVSIHAPARGATRSLHVNAHRAR